MGHNSNHCQMHALCACANTLPVTCSVKMVEPVGHPPPEPEAEPCSLTCSDSSESNPNRLLEVLRAPVRGDNWHTSN